MDLSTFETVQSFSSNCRHFSAYLGHYLLQFTDDPGLGPSASQQAAFVAAYRAEQIAALQAHQRQLEKAQR